MATPMIWKRQVSTDSLKVGCTAAMAPSMAKISRELVAPYRSTMTMAVMMAAAVLTVRRPTWILGRVTGLPSLPVVFVYHTMGTAGPSNQMGEK